MKFNTVIFLKEPEDSINRQARIETWGNRFHIVNANMPYQGSINIYLTKEELDLKIKNKEIQLK